MVFHALMHDYEACENIFFNPFQVQNLEKNLILTFHELLISCQFFMIFSSEVWFLPHQNFYAYYVNWWMVI